MRHIFPSAPPISIFLSLCFSFFSLFLSPSLEACVLPPLALQVLSKALISLVLACFCMYSHCLLSPIVIAYQSPFMCKDFFISSPPCLLSACFYFSTVAHNKMIHNIGCSKAIDASSFCIMKCKQSRSTKDLIWHFSCMQCTIIHFKASVIRPWTLYLLKSFTSSYLH